MKHKITTMLASILLANCAPGPVKSISVEAAKDISVSILKERAARNAPAGTGMAAVELNAVRGVEIDELGEAHTRVSQTFKGIPVMGAEAIVHLDADGVLKDITDKSATDLDIDTTPTITSQQAIEVAVQNQGGWQELSDTPTAELQILNLKRYPRQLVWRVQLNQLNGTSPRMPLAFVNAHRGEVTLAYDNLKSLKNREVHNLAGGTNMPGPIARIEGQGPIGETIVNANYDRLGNTYDCYKGLFNRDGINNAGGKLISTVHYGVRYDNAHWTGTQMLYGDGHPMLSGNLVLASDVTAHELTHGVTEATSNLFYNDGESGGLNEGMSDIFGAVCEWYQDGSGNLTAPTSANTWMVGESIWRYGQALRFMNDPIKDGYSVDHTYAEIGRYGEAHSTSGIPNLAFYLLSQGGTHPRGKTTVNVKGIGIYAAARIFYRVNTVYLTQFATFTDARLASVKAAEDLYGVGSQQALSARDAWVAVGVSDVVIPPVAYVPVNTKIINIPKGQTQRFTVPSNGVAAINFDASGSTSGYLQMYIKFGSPPTETSYDCNWVFCEFNPAKNGDYHVLLGALPDFGIKDVKFTTKAAKEVCGDNIDNDADGKIDCADSDCQLFPACLPATETSCLDKADADNDGKIDCADSDCATHPFCLPETQCADGKDNNMEGLIDCDDPDCAPTAICSAANFVTLSNATFETGITPYVAGGADAARISNATYAGAGTFSVRLRDDSGVASSITSATAMNLSSKSRLKINFKYLTVGMNEGDSFLIEVLDGANWEYVTRIVSEPNTNNIHQTITAEVNLNTLSNKSAVKIRFRSDAPTDANQIYVDDIKVTAK